jgi:RNA polymerase sigma factor (sigma-70 family)
MNPDSLANNSTEILIEGCRKGDRKAQFEIYKSYYQAMYNVCLRIVNDRTEAEDIMQDSFLAAFDKISQFRGDVSFGAWLKRIVINRSLDYLKKKKIVFADIKQTRLSDEILFQHDSDPETFEFEAIRKVEEVKEAMAQLAEGYRIILNLHLIEDMGFDDIAGMMNISSSTVRSQYARGRKKLIEVIKENKTIYENGYA